MAELTLHDNVLALSTAFWSSRTLQIIAELGIADALNDALETAEQLAKKTGTDADALHRALRLLASHGIFEFRDGAWTHTAASRLLREDHPRSVRAFCRPMGAPASWQSWGHLEHAVRTGQTALSKLERKGIFAYLTKHPEESRIFNAGMEAKAQRDIPALLEAYDFSAFKTIADIGGGRGHLLLSILGVTPNATGILFDQPHVIAEAANEPRLKCHAGDFFQGDLPTADAYLLMDILHDWNDADAARILTSIRRAAMAQSKLLIFETIIPDMPGPHLAKALDVNMLVMTGGRERTVAEHSTLLKATGFELERVKATASPYSIVQARVV